MDLDGGTTRSINQWQMMPIRLPEYKALKIFFARC